MEEKIKMAVIAGASNALKLKTKNPRLDDEKIIEMVSKNTREIIAKIDNF